MVTVLTNNDVELPLCDNSQRQNHVATSVATLESGGRGCCLRPRPWPHPEPTPTHPAPAASIAYPIHPEAVSGENPDQYISTDNGTVSNIVKTTQTAEETKKNRLTNASLIS
jgi:hypothetical protein